MGNLGRRLARLEQQSPVVQPCRWCEQAYWTMVADNPAIGLYSETEYGSEVSRVTLRAYDDLLRECGYEVRDRYHRDDLPTTWIKQRSTRGLWRPGTLSWSRGRPGKGASATGRGRCCGISRPGYSAIIPALQSDYPRVAERLIEALEHYAASPLDPRTLYHWPMGDENCVCTPRDISL